MCADNVLTWIWGKTKKPCHLESSQTCLCPVRFKCQHWAPRPPFVNHSVVAPSMHLFVPQLASFLSATHSVGTQQCLHVCGSLRITRFSQHSLFLNNRCLNHKWLTCTFMHAHTLTNTHIRQTHKQKKILIDVVTMQDRKMEQRKT